MQQFQRRLACAFAHLPHHGCQLENAGFTLEGFHLGGGAPGMHMFLHAIVLLAEGCQLRQVGDAQHLVLAGQVAQLAAYHSAHAPANALVDLIEDQGGHLVGACQHIFDRQHEPRGFATGGRFHQRFETLARVEGHEELDMLQPVDIESHPLPISQGHALRIWAGLEIHAKAGRGHVQIFQLVFHRAGQGLGGGMAFLRERRPLAAQVVPARAPRRPPAQRCAHRHA